MSGYRCRRRTDRPQVALSKRGGSGLAGSDGGAGFRQRSVDPSLETALLHVVGFTDEGGFQPLLCADQQDAGVDFVLAAVEQKDAPGIGDGDILRSTATTDTGELAGLAGIEIVDDADAEVGGFQMDDGAIP